MRTEEQIVYDVMNIASGGRVSADDVISERLVRSFLRKYRASKMAPFFNKGARLSDYIFQSLGDLEFKQTSEFEYSVTLPALINFEENFSVKITKSRMNIPLLGEEEYELALSNPINKTFPKAKLEETLLTLFIGKADSCNYLESSLKENVVSTFNEEASVLDDEPRVFANVKAVLYDPDQGLNYNWTKTPYPCPSEIIEQIETSTLARDFDLMIRTRFDQADNKSQIDNVGE
tara:strand:- start:60851 stop:61549 length:699 start_codon:yes stop_codon:yes gene_type:complete